MTDAEIEMAAAADPDSRPADKPFCGNGRWLGLEGTLRLRLGLTHEAFASRYHVPADTLRAWERGQATPDAVAQAYLRLIAADPEGVAAIVARADVVQAAE